MNLPLNLRYLAQDLSQPKPGTIMAIVTERGRTKRFLPSDAYEPLVLAHWRSFCHSVWHPEAVGPCRLITRLRAEIAGGRWCGEAWWANISPIIEVCDEGLTRITALHEVAHLVTNRDDPAGDHRPVFAREFVRLISTWISPEAASAWHGEWTAALLWAEQHEGWPPD
jgi:hypothetical protein